jgi:hypothetical protein
MGADLPGKCSSYVDLSEGRVRRSLIEEDGIHCACERQNKHPTAHRIEKPMRTLLLCCIALSTHFLFHAPSFGQPLQAGAEEIQVSTSASRNNLRPAIMVNDDGHAWIIWENGSRRYHPDGRPEGGQIESHNYVGAAMYAGDDTWAIFHEHGRNHRFLLVRPGLPPDSTAIMFKTRYVYDPTHHGYSENEWVTDRALIRVGHSGIFTTGRHYEGHQGAGLDWSSATAELYVLDPPTREIRLLSDIDLFTMDDWTTHAPQFIASTPMEGSVIVLARYAQGSDMVRAVRVLNLANMQPGPEKRVDTVRFWKNDYSSTSLRYRPDQIDVLSQKQNVQGLSIDRIDTSGHILETFQDGELSMVNASDYIAGTLSDGRNVLVWSRQVNERTGHLYARVFDARWRSVGPEKQINSIDSGMNTRATISIRSDTVSFAWHSDRSGQLHVYLRRFSTSQLTAAQEPIAVPRTLTVSSPFPNPLPTGARSVTIPLQSRGSGVLRISLYDNLGRAALSSRYDAQPGMQLLRLELPTMLPGVYLLRIADEAQMEMRRLVIH